MWSLKFVFMMNKFVCRNTKPPSDRSQLKLMHEFHFFSFGIFEIL